MSLRPARPDDAPAIAHIHVASWQAAYSGLVPQPYLDSLDPVEFTARWQTWLAATDRIATYVAEIGDSLVGFVSGGPLREPLPPFDCELYALYLLPSAHRHGIGRQLFATLANHLLSGHRASLLLWSLRDNPATAFYSRLGGAPVADGTTEIGARELPTRAFGWPHLADRSWA